jgi:hypothetical protein
MEVEFKDGVEVKTKNTFKSFRVYVTKDDDISISIGGCSFNEHMRFSSIDEWNKVKELVDATIKKAVEYKG